MPRPVLERDPSYQLTVLSRMLRQVDVDSRYGKARKKKLKRLISELMGEFQKETVNGHARDEAAS